MSVLSDRDIRAEPADQVLIVGTRGRDHLRALPPRELDRELADAAGPAVDQHALPRFQPGMVEQALPRRHRRKRDRRRRRHVETVGDGAQLHRLDDDVI